MKEGGAERKGTRGRRLRHRFTLVVFTAIGVGAGLELLRPEEEWPRFAAPPDVELDPLQAPGGEEELRGTVLDARGAAADDVLVEVLARGRPYWGYTRADGSFRLQGLPAGQHVATLVRFGEPAGREPFELPAPGPVRWRLPAPLADADPLPPVARDPAAGRLLPSAGSAVAGCEVLVVPAAGTDPLSGAITRRVSADEGGAFRLPDLVHGTYVARALPSWAQGGTWPVLAEVEFEHRGPDTAVLAPLGGGRIAVELADAGGAPVEAALILAWPADEPRRVWPPVQTDARGRAAVRDLPEGRYRVALRAGEHASEREVDVAAGASVDVDFGPLELR